MAKKKKKGGAHLRKISQAQQRNEFINRLKKFCDEVAGPGTFNLIPASQVDNMYLLRSHPIRVYEAPGHFLPKDVLHELRDLSLLMFKHWQVSFDIGNLKTISVYDFFTVGLTLLMHTKTIKESSYPNSFIVKQRLAPLDEMMPTKRFQNVWNKYRDLAMTLNVLFSDIGSGFYALKNTMKLGTGSVPEIHYCLEAYRIKTEEIKVSIDGHRRSVYRVGWSVSDPEPYIEYIKIPSAALNKLPGFFLNVYIQEHALNRLSERMDGIPPGFLQFSMYNSLRDPKIFRNKDGTLLIPFLLSGKKTGYFVALQLEDKIIIRTFLFLTHSGTPEGQKLHELFGLQKKDVTYLTIDKLSTFMESDIARHPEVKQIFMTAGCKNLFEIDDKIYSPHGCKKQALADFFLKYLNRADPP